MGTSHHSGHVDCQELSGNSKNSSQKIYIYIVGHQSPGHQHGCHFILLANLEWKEERKCLLPLRYSHGSNNAIPVNDCTKIVRRFPERSHIQYLR